MEGYDYCQLTPIIGTTLFLERGLREPKQSVCALHLFAERMFPPVPPLLSHAEGIFLASFPPKLDAAPETRCCVCK